MLSSNLLIRAAGAKVRRRHFDLPVIPPGVDEASLEAYTEEDQEWANRGESGKPCSARRPSSGQGLMTVHPTRFAGATWTDQDWEEYRAVLDYYGHVWAGDLMV